MKKTPLNDIHRKLGARMVDFAGWDMPVQYAGVREEHTAVRTKCGIFDVSHMGEVEIVGPEALAIVQKLTCNDASRLSPGQSQYSALLTERGTFVDDIIVNRLAADRFLICVNASNTDKDFEWMKRQEKAGTKVINRSDEYFLIAVQGPEAVALVAKLWSPPLPPKTFTFVETTITGVPVILSRTGYT
jgi:aminomethyltransferase